MGHDVYVCYDDKNHDIANKICNELENNRFKCWIKSRDVGVGNDIDEMVEAINQSTMMVLVFSENSKNSNFVNTEVDFAFKYKKPILVYNVDGTALDGGLELFIRNQPSIDAYPNPEEKFDVLTRDVSEIVRGNRPSFWKRHKVHIIIAVVAIILIAAIGIFMVNTSDVGNNGSSDVQINPGDIKIKVTDFHVDDVRKESSSWNYSYFVGGTISPEPGNPDNCRLIVDFYDKSGELVDSSETVLSDAQKVSSGYVLGSAVSDTNNIKRIDVQLVNSDNIILAQSESQL